MRGTPPLANQPTADYGAPAATDPSMLSVVRKFLNTKAAKVFFVLLIIPFLMWGVADVVRNAGSETALATVGDRKIEPQEFQEAYRKQLAQVSRTLGVAEPTPEQRRRVAATTLDSLLYQAAIADEARRLGLAVPDQALRDAVFAVPEFRGRTGAFDRRVFESVLRDNGFSEASFLQKFRADLAQRQMIEAVQAPVTVPDALVRPVFAYAKETRIAEIVELPFAAAPEPPEPTDAELRGAYQDDPGRYTAPAYRHVKAVILTPDQLARGIEVSDADVAAYAEAHKAEFASEEKRSIEVLISQDEAVATKLAETWRAGADWAAIQAAATEAAASAVAVEDASRAAIPGTELADAAFAAAPDTVTGPIKSAFGWQVVRVTKVTPPGSIEGATDLVRARIARERAVDQVYARVNKLEDVLAAGVDFDKVPTDLGATALGGTLDAKGETREGEPIPIPGSPALRQAFIAAAFAAPKDAIPKLIEGPDQSYFALTVDDETPAAPRPFDEVRDQVRDNVERDARRKAQETVAAKLLAALNTGTSLDDAATVAGLRVDRTPPIGRGEPPEGVAPELARSVFTLHQGGATLVETPAAFHVVRLAGVDAPEPATDPAAAAQLRTELDKQLGADVAATYATALRNRSRPTVNQTMLQSLTQ